MAHEIAKLMLEHAGTFLERSEAVKTALYLGMPLEEIESYLDWLESTGELRGASAAEPGRLARREEATRKAAGAKGRPSAPPIGPLGCPPPFPRPAGQ